MIVMVFTVRCFKCGEDAVRLVLGGRQILHAKCESCDANLLDEVMRFELEVVGQQKPKRERQPTIEIATVGEDDLGDDATVASDDS